LIENSDDETKREAILSFLYYNGLISIDREHEDYEEKSNLILKISNNIAKKNFFWKKLNLT
jgi:hypothetical protein